MTSPRVKHCQCRFLREQSVLNRILKITGILDLHSSTTDRFAYQGYAGTLIGSDFIAARPKSSPQVRRVECRDDGDMTKYDGGLHSDIASQLGCEMEDGPAGPFIQTDFRKATSVFRGLRLR